MAYYKNRIREEMKTFSFSANKYTVSSEINVKYKQLKTQIHDIINLLTQYKIDSSKKFKYMEENIEFILSFYDDCSCFMAILIDEIFKNPLENKKDLFILIDKMFKIFFVFDVIKHKHPNFFSDFARYRDDSDSTTNEKFALLTALAMPMAHCFVSYFSSENIEIHAPSKLIRRNAIYLDDNKKEHLYKLGCIVCKYDYEYCRIFFSGLFNKFFQSAYFLQFIEKLHKQKGAYYVAIAEYH